MVAQMAMFDGLAERDRIIAAFRENSRPYLTALRSFARVHAMRNGTVTIDDVRATIEREQFPMPSDIGKDERVFGAVFASPDFIAVDQQPTRRAARIARAGRGASFVTRYRLREAS